MMRARREVIGKEHVVCSIVGTFVAALPATGRRLRPKPGTLKEALEKQSLEAWKKRDGNFYQDYLADAVELTSHGAVNKSGIVAGTGVPPHVVTSFTVDHFALTSNAALLTCQAAQDTTCEIGRAHV